jgi:hypothetical protein
LFSAADGRRWTPISSRTRIDRINRIYRIESNQTKPLLPEEGCVLWDAGWWEVVPHPCLVKPPSAPGETRIRFKPTIRAETRMIFGDFANY